MKQGMTEGGRAYLEAVGGMVDVQATQGARLREGLVEDAGSDFGVECWRAVETLDAHLETGLESLLDEFEDCLAKNCRAPSQKELRRLPTPALKYQPRPSDSPPDSATDNDTDTNTDTNTEPSTPGATSRDRAKDRERNRKRGEFQGAGSASASVASASRSPSLASSRSTQAPAGREGSDSTAKGGGQRPGNPESVPLAGVHGEGEGASVSGAPGVDRRPEAWVAMDAAALYLRDVGRVLFRAGRADQCLRRYK